jgi:hypothetical protein
MSLEAHEKKKERLLEKYVGFLERLNFIYARMRNNLR